MMITATPKPASKSKTIILAGLVALAAILDFVDVLDLPAAERILVGLAPLIALLRMYTHRPLSIFGHKK